MRQLVPEIPVHWQRARIDEIAIVRSGSTPLRSKDERYFQNGTIPWIKTMDLNNGYVSETDENITAVALKESSCPLLEPGTVLVAMYGGFNQIGRTGIMTFRGSINQAISALIIDRAQAVPEYVLNWLNANVHLWRHIAASSRKDPNITRSDVMGFPVLLPPLAEQRKIAAILGTWDEAINRAERLVAALKARKKALMQRLLTGEVRFSGFAGEWEIKRFDQVFARVTRKNTVGNTNVLTASGMHGLVSQVHYFNRSVAGADLSGYYLLKHGEFAYNRSSSDGYPYGAIKQLQKYDAGILSTLYLCFRLADESCDANFYRHFFEAGGMERGIYSIAQEGARNHGLLNVGVADFFSLDIPVPTPTEQRRLADFFNTVDAEIELAIQQRNYLQQQKRGLMQRLLTGEVRVAVDG